MPISREVREALTRSSWIRRMFEEGTKLKKLHGEDQVFDFSLGNPDLPPPEFFTNRLREILERPPPGLHRYMPNAGWPEVRQKIAVQLERRCGLPYRGENIVMTVGAGGALNVCLKAILDPGDEVIVFAPYFVEYHFYIANHAGRVVAVETRGDFSIDAEALAKAITARTRAVIINSPNNPTGVVYRHEEIAAVAAALARASRTHGRPIYLISDEPYRKIVYPPHSCPEVAPLYEHTVLITSHSKDLGLAGERIGYLAISPRAADAADLFSACTFCNRTLGFVNAPSLFQWAVADCQEAAVDVGTYRERRDLLVAHLRELGFELAEPGGAFYLFPRSPVPDETEFVTRLLESRILVVPGRGFGRPGYFRVSFAVPTETIRRSLPAWEEAARGYPALRPPAAAHKH
ncbi:MAG: pyridoxal phosphate-dependent aminotransferase [Planctomycetes bacterium]|nr:pyridoxal phosphate-dependent aminotransferase [Planctomycetota bacterium]